MVVNEENVPTHFSHEMTVISDFESTNGKFGDRLGNVALIDCHFANKLILNTYNNTIISKLKYFCHIERHSKSLQFQIFLEFLDLQ